MIRQIQKNDISDKKLQEIGHFDKKLIERFETGVISVIKLIEMKETIIAILHEKDIQEQVNMHEKGHRERDFYAAYMALEHNQTKIKNGLPILYKKHSRSKIKRILKRAAQGWR